ncbi:hypothetical protein R1flu_013469 [Riccia fluitans]|uniref:Uncharacterized protein n=1 Tax=Riccia fluitans TaxID=41844 RepID=A0ABD1YDH0_9MARC
MTTIAGDKEAQAEDTSASCHGVAGVGCSHSKYDTRPFGIMLVHKRSPNPPPVLSVEIVALAFREKGVEPRRESSEIVLLSQILPTLSPAIGTPEYGHLCVKCVNRRISNVVLLLDLS